MIKMQSYQEYTDGTVSVYPLQL